MILFCMGVGIAIGHAVRPSWSITVTRSSPATRDQIWAWYADLRDAPKWDPTVKELQASGPLVAGTHGEKIPASGPPMNWEVTSAVSPDHYTAVSKLAFASIVETRALRAKPGGTEIQHRVTVSGPLAWAYELVLRKQMQTGMTTAIDNLAERAQKGPPQ